MTKIKFICLLLIVIAKVSYSQTPAPALIGYWQNWNDSQCPYIQLTQIDSSYNIIPVAFAIPVSGTSYNMSFIPDGISQINFKKKIDTMHIRGKKILISIGGANDPVYMNDTNQRNIFISSMINIINTYGFDGIDIDLEGSSLSLSGGTISNPVDVRIINLIYAVRKIMDLYRLQFGRKMILTMAPETAYVQGGMSAYAGIWGAYLPVIHALRDSIEVLHVQLYNSGSMYGIDGNIYFQGTVDFILSQTEAVIRGFNTAGGYFTGLRPDQVAVGLPACSNAAGGGYIIPDSVKAAILYLKGVINKPARYTCLSAYPDLRGMMDWSINWDATPTCGGVYEYANNFNNIFNPSLNLNLTLFIQGFYRTSSHSTIQDTVKINLRNSVSPYQIKDSSKGYLNSSGNAVINFRNSYNGINYFVQTNHRNSLETWSSAPLSFSNSSASYNFSTSLTQAYGNNMIQTDSSPLRFGIYSGDVNQNGVIDATDIGLIDNDASNFVSGYILSDVNGDQIADGSDFMITDNNAFNFVSVARP